VFHFVFHAVPKEPMPDTAGAYVSCWIDFRQRDGAELLARFYVEQSGWIPGEVEEATWVEEDRYEGTPELQYVREARQDGASFVFHCHPDE
jgi:hypothetical protein